MLAENARAQVTNTPGFAMPPLKLEAYLAPGAGAGAVIAVEVWGKIQLYFGELSTMKWIRNATTTPVPM